MRSIYSLSEAVELMSEMGLETTTDALRQAIRHGNLAADKIGSQWVVTFSECERYAKNKRSPGGYRRKSD